MNSLRLNLSIALFLLPFLFSQNLYAQHNTSIDSLRHVLHSTAVDTNRVNVLQSIVKQFMQQDEMDSALKYCNESIQLSKNLDFKKGLTAAYYDKGKILIEQRNFPEALNIYQEELEIHEQAGDKKNQANVYNLIANAFHLQGDYLNALKNQYTALKIREEIGDEEGISWSYNNIGTIYRIQEDYPAALKNYYSALRLLEKFGNLKNIAYAHSNIGSVYSFQNKHTDALNSFLLALKLRQQVGGKKEIVESYINIGDAFCDLYEKDSLTKEVRVEFAEKDIRTIPRAEWLNTAMEMQSNAQTMNEEHGNKYYSIFILSGIGRINYLKKNHKESIRLYTRAYGIAEEMSAVELQKEIAKYLADNYDSLNDFKNEMHWYVKYTEHKDSLFNALKSDDLTRTRMKYEFDKKEAETMAVQEKKDAVAKVELDRQKKMRNIFLGGFALVLLFAGVFFYQRNNIRKEKVRSDDLLLNILPSEIADELKQTGVSRTKSFDEVTVVFTDFVDFTIVSEKIGPEALVEEIHTCFSAFDNIIQKHKVEKIKTIGDAYLCVGGLPVTSPGHAVNAVNASIEIMEYMQQRKKIKESKNEIPFELRIGIHSGPVVAGIVGLKKYAYDIWGDTVNIAARMEQNSLPGKINISNRTYDLVKDEFKCTYRGKIEAKNKGEIDMYFLEGDRAC